MTKLNSFFLAILAIAASGQVSAAIKFTTYTAFANATVDQTPVIDTYADLTVGTILASGSSRNGITYQFSASVGTDGYIDGSSQDFSGYYLTTGPGQSFQPGDTVTFSFATPINSFGLNIYSAYQTLFQLITNAETPEAANTSTSSWDEGYSYFLGMDSNIPFTSITLSGGYQYRGRGGMVPYSGWSIPRVVYGVAGVPLPASFWFLLSGLTVILGLSRHKNLIR